MSRPEVTTVHPVDRPVSDGDHALHDGYVSMATANGVDAADPALRRCRLSSYEMEKLS